MTQNGWFQIGLYLFVIFLVTKPIGVFMTRVFNREKTFLDAVLRPIEKLVYRLTGVNEKHEMRWTEYAVAMLLFSGVSMTVLYLIERTQKWLPFNPQKFPNVEPALAFGTAASFTTNTNWQVYSGESTMSYLTQMAGLAYHNFVSAAVGIVLAIVVIRGIARKETDKLGNFWVDTTRCLLWVLLPVCLVGSLILVSEGVRTRPKLRVQTARPPIKRSRNRSSRKGQWPHRKSSKNSAPTAVDSLTPTALILSKIPHRFRTFSKWY